MRTKHKRTGITYRIHLLITLFFSAAVAAGEMPRPNILVLMAEDMSPRVGAFGDSPAAEKLARTVSPTRW